MKKFTCLVIALMLCLTATAFAESVPSRMTGDMTSIEVAAENMPADSGFFIQPVPADDPVYQEKIVVCNAEIEKLAGSSSVETYFGEIKDNEGNIVSLKDVLGTDTLNVFEFCPLIAGEYEEAYGKVTAKMLFSTPYEKDEKVIVMIGLVTVDVNGNQSIQWTAYEGIGLGAVEGATEEMGGIQVELDSEIVKAIEEGTALLAVVSK